jgi:hypothetical protein
MNTNKVWLLSSQKAINANKEQNTDDKQTESAISNFNKWNISSLNE